MMALKYVTVVFAIPEEELAEWLENDLDVFIESEESQTYEGIKRNVIQGATVLGVADKRPTV
jgi:hypothetical protein